MEIYEAGRISQVAINLFYGWGYNFYRSENQLRADDLLVRSKVSEIIGASRLAVESAESEYRREFLPAPSRAQPRQDPTALKNVALIEGIARSLGAIEGEIRALPVPETDRVTQLHRKERETLERLGRADLNLVGCAELLRETVVGMAADQLLSNALDINARLKVIQAALADRRAVLTIHGRVA